MFLPPSHVDDEEKGALGLEVIVRRGTEPEEVRENF